MGNIKAVKNIVWIIPIAIYMWLFLSLQLWQIDLKQLTSGWGIFTILLIVDIVGLIISCAGMMVGNKIFEKIFVILNAIYLLSGLYMVHFAWTFYIFKVPTITERIASTRNVIAFGILMPLLLFYYLERNNTGKHS